MRCLAKDRRGGVALAVVALSLTTLSLCHESSAQSVAVGNCKPVSERTTEVGCWIVAHQPVGQLTTQTFWYLDVYPTRAAAEAAKGPRGTVVESLGRVWLAAGEEYSAQYMEAILNPGMTSSIHTHAGPEAWYTSAGETCLETPEHKYVGRAGGEPVIVPGGPPMLLTATGTEQRRAGWLFHSRSLRMGGVGRDVARVADTASRVSHLYNTSHRQVS